MNRMTFNSQDKWRLYEHHINIECAPAHLQVQSSSQPSPLSTSVSCLHLLVLLIFNYLVFKGNFSSYLLPRKINMIFLSKFSLCWRGLLKVPFLGALPVLLRISVSSGGPLYPYYLPHPYLKPLFSFITIILSAHWNRKSFCLVWIPASQFVLCITATVTEHILKEGLHVSTDTVLPTGSQKCWCQPSSQEYVSDEIQTHLCQDSII